jgi:hypothetical protein
LEDEPVEENEVGDESFEEVENDFKPHAMVNIAAGEKITSTMHFNYPHFSIDTLRNFIMQAPIPGWQASSNENFNSASITCVEEELSQKAFSYCLMNTHNCTKFVMTKLTNYKTDID